MNKTKQVLTILKKYNAKKDQRPDWTFVTAQVISCALEKKPLTLINFTCSKTNPEYMYDQKNPELYIKLDPAGNNMEADLPTLTKLYQELDKIYPIKIIILIGNTDPFYIYTEEGQKLPNFTEKEFWTRFNKRWSNYKLKLEQYLIKNFPDLKSEVISWYELEQDWKAFGWDFRQQYFQTLKKISSYCVQSDFDWELNKLNQAFGIGKYFGALQKPTQTTLKNWVKRKFAEYTVQGLWIKQIYPNAILLQNEKPSMLRTKMYQPLIKERLNSKLPVLYPYGIDNSGYQ